MLDFDPKSAAKFIQMGAKEAKAVIDLGPGESFKKLMETRDNLVNGNI